MLKTTPRAWQAHWVSGLTLPEARYPGPRQPRSTPVSVRLSLVMVSPRIADVGEAQLGYATRILNEGVPEWLVLRHGMIRLKVCSL